MEVGIEQAQRHCGGEDPVAMLWEYPEGGEKGCPSPPPTVPRAQRTQTRRRAQSRQQEKGLTGGGADGGVLDLEESGRHVGGGLMERPEREERGLMVAIEDRGEGTRREGRERWGYC